MENVASIENSGAGGGLLPFVGESEALVGLRNRLSLVARAQRTTLICGPTGSGKEVVAQRLHAHSTRAGRPYVTVHCAALPEALVESEMFGHNRGAFTGAHQTRNGLVKSAQNGTLFLDEIDSLPLAAQAKLLRFLESGEYRAVGADRSEHADVWFIAATNQDLEERVRSGLFRADLLYRLSVVRLDLPALTARRSDILPLAEHFLARLGFAAEALSPDARAALTSYDWPGNVRELKHRVEAAALLCAGARIEVDDLNLPICAAPCQAAGTSDELESRLWSCVQQGMTMAQVMERCERTLIQAALAAEGNNRTRAAGRLGIHVRTIFKKLA